jgi:hypothetical protein
LGSQEGEVFLKECKEKLSESGAVVLNSFINMPAVEKVISNLEPSFDNIYYCSNEHNAYLIKDDLNYSSDHPRNQKVFSDKGLLAYDQISENSLLRELYNSPILQNFIARLMDSDKIYPYADPLSPINVNISSDGRQLGWHYDNTPFVTTLMLRPAEKGGDYEYVPWLRSKNEQNYDELGKVLNNESNRVEVLHQDTGAFVLFKGQYTVHRVTPSYGEARLIAILSYGSEPGKTLTKETQRIFYGRTV